MASLCVSIESQGEIHCADCDAAWSMPVIAAGHGKRELRQMGFAFIDFGDALCINRCPHCDEPPSARRTPSWPNALPLH